MAASGENYMAAVRRSSTRVAHTDRLLSQRAGVRTPELLGTSCIMSRYHNNTGQTAVSAEEFGRCPLEAMRVREAISRYRLKWR